MQRLMSLAAASVLLWGLADTHGLATEQQQDQQPALDGLREGIQMVEDGDYAAAIEVLEAALLELEADRAAPSEMARSYFYAGVARVFIVGDDEARFAFHEAQQHDPQFRPTADQFPRRVIRLWEEASTMEVEAESLAGGEAAGTLTVITEPAAATVYVAGRPRGETPVEVVGLSAGDQRVTIVKDGYINNSRVLALAPNSAERLSVELTAAAAEGSAAALQEDSEEGGGSGWWEVGRARWRRRRRRVPPLAKEQAAGCWSDRLANGLRHGWGNELSLRRKHLVGPGQRLAHLLMELRRWKQRLRRQCDARVQPSRHVHCDADGERRQGTGNYHPLCHCHSESCRDLYHSNVPSRHHWHHCLNFGEDHADRHESRGNTAFRFSGAVSTQTVTGTLSGRISSSNNFICPCDVQFTARGYSFTGSINNGATLLAGNDRLVINKWASSQGRWSTSGNKGAELWPAL